MLIDAHVHLEGFDSAGLAKALDEARQAGLVVIITSGMTPETSAAAVQIANAHDIVYGSVGIHPWNVAEMLDDETLGTLRDLAVDNEKVIAISETGLDFARCPGTVDQQMAVFRQHIRLAREVNRPLIVHGRDAHEDLIRILSEEKAAEVGGAAHGFTGTMEMAEDYLDLGFYISFGRALVRLENAALWEVAKKVPINRILTETDTAPGYAPPGMLPPGPASVLEVAEKLAELKGLSVDDIGAVTTENLKRLTGVPH